MGSWFKLFVLLALHFPPCLPPPPASCLLSPACIFYGHVKQKQRLLSHAGAHHLLIHPQEKDFASASSWESVQIPVFYTAKASKRLWDLRKNTLHEFLFFKSVSGLIGRFLAWAQYYINVASRNVGVNPRSLIYIGSYLKLKPLVCCCFYALRSFK